MRIGDLPTHDRHQIGMARRQHRVRTVVGAHVALGLHQRMRRHRLQRRSERHPEIGRIQRRRHQLVEVEVAARATGDVVHQPALVVPRHDLAHLRQRQRRRSVRVDVHRQPDHEVVATRLTDPTEDRRRQPHPVLERAAPLVGAPVRPRRPELIDQRVVRGEHLHPVEPGRLRTLRRPHERPDDLHDLVARHRMAAIGIVVRGQPRRRPVRLERVVGITVLTHVVQLLDHHGRQPVGIGLGPAHVDQPTERLDHRIVVGPEVATGQHRRSMHRHRLHHDHPGPAPRPLAVVAHVPFRRQPVDAHVRRVRPERDPRPQRPTSEQQRLHDVIHAASLTHPPQAKNQRDLHASERASTPTTVTSRRSPSMR